MKHLLIADDEPLIQLILKEIFINEYELEFANDGIACLRSIEERIPDLLLLDIAMPEMSGLEVCRQLRENERTKAIPIIFISAYAAKHNVEEGLAAGADRYITKPFKPHDILAEVKSLLEESEHTSS